MDAKPTGPYREPGHDEPSEPCSQCGRPVSSLGHPESIARWCTNACHDAWMAADPKRSEGWISLSDLTIEQTAELFRRSGMDLSFDGVPVGGRTPS